MAKPWLKPALRSVPFFFIGWATYAFTHLHIQEGAISLLGGLMAMLAYVFLVRSKRNPAELVAYQSAYAVKELLPLAVYGLGHMYINEGLSTDSQERFCQAIRCGEEVLKKINEKERAPKGGIS